MLPKILSSKESKDQEKIQIRKIGLLYKLRDQGLIMGNELKSFSKFLREQKQDTQAAQTEQFVESKGKSRKSITKISRNEDEKKSSGILSLLVNGFFVTLFAFLPTILKKLNESKKELIELPDKITKSISGALDVFAESIRVYIVDPLKRFFNVIIPAAWDTLSIAIGDAIQSIVYIPLSIINSVKIYVKDLQIGAIDALLSFIKKSRVASFLFKGHKNEIKEMQERNKKERLDIQKQQKDLDTERAAIKNTRYGNTFKQEVARREPKEEKESKDSGAISKEVPPEGRALLDAIAKKESVELANAMGIDPYRIIVGASAGKSNEKRKLSQKHIQDNTAKGFPTVPAEFIGFEDHPRLWGYGNSTAAGRYQFTASTWDDIRKRYSGLTNFSPENQDKAAWILAQERYKRITKKSLLEALQNGELLQISKVLNKTWTSLPGGQEQARGVSEGLVATYEKSLQNSKGERLNVASANLPDDTPTKIKIVPVAMQDNSGNDMVKKATPNIKTTPNAMAAQGLYPALLASA